MRVTLFYCGPSIELWDRRVVDGSTEPVKVEMDEAEAEALFTREPILWLKNAPGAKRIASAVEV